MIYLNPTCNALFSTTVQENETMSINLSVLVPALSRERGWVILTVRYQVVTSVTRKFALFNRRPGSLSDKVLPNMNNVISQLSYAYDAFSLKNLYAWFSVLPLILEGPRASTFSLLSESTRSHVEGFFWDANEWRVTTPLLNRPPVWCDSLLITFSSVRDFQIQVPICTVNWKRTGKPREDSHEKKRKKGQDFRKNLLESVVETLNGTRGKEGIRGVSFRKKTPRFLTPTTFEYP